MQLAAETKKSFAFRVIGRNLALAIAVLAGMFASSCGTKVVDYTTLYLNVRSEPTQTPIVALDLAVHSLPGVTPEVIMPPPGETAGYVFALPANQVLVSSPFLLKVQLTDAGGQYQLRVRGLDKDNTVVASAFLVIDTRNKAMQDVMLRAPKADCDADADGVPDCNKPGCCADKNLLPGDCNDDPANKGKESSPFNKEDPCTQCGDGVDQDCNGSDTPCVDTDGDKIPDCQETKCGPGAANDPTVYPGAAEVCDGKDNDCNGAVDDGLPFVDIDGKSAVGKKGDACGKGICAGGTIVCAPVDKDGKSTSLVCDTAIKKAAAEDCSNNLDDDCDGKINNGCTPQDIDADGISNDDEDAACMFKYAKFHAEYHPNAPEKCCLPGKDKDLCDTNCDKQITPCDPDDKDGDGQTAGKDDDCDDTNPMVNHKAAEKCGDGIDQDCQGGDAKCDASFIDVDGDHWSAPADCDDNNAAVNPDAKEVCDSIDNDCNGIADDTNPETGDATTKADAVCGNDKGECFKQRGSSVCKHYPAGQEPDTLDCLTKPFDAKSLICVGCFGDHRPAAKETCNYLDDDCNGTTDDNYLYPEEKSGNKLTTVGVTGKQDVACDGVGACGVGVVECNTALDKAVCTTDKDGSQHQDAPDVCNNIDDNCNGKTDEDLTAVGDSSCRKVGVCSGANTSSITTVCIAGKWLCDYSSVAKIEYDKNQPCAPGTDGCNCQGLGQSCFKMVEASCDSLDNDCDGKTDDDFSYSGPGALGKTLLIADPCGTGECKNGTVVCKDATSLFCDKDPLIKDEICDAKDNDCDGQTDELSKPSMAFAKSPCRQIAPCSQDTVVATCPAGVWQCDYSKVPDYEGTKIVTCIPSNNNANWSCPSETELTCDAKDNDCDGQTDEDFTFSDLGVAKKISQACGTGECKNGTVICSATPAKKAQEMTCATLVNVKTEVCDYKDNDCNGVTDENVSYSQWDGTKLPVINPSDGLQSSCDAVGACGVGVVECISTMAATCSTDANGTKHQDIVESCNDIDDDCNGITDDHCDDDKDGYCDVALKVSTPSPKICPKGGNDCQKDNANVNPSITEACDSIDNNCNGSTDETFFYKEPNGVPVVVGQPCGLGVCAVNSAIVKCQDKSTAYCPGYLPLAEICDGKDNDCNGITDDGCDDDADGYCDATMILAPGFLCKNTKIGAIKGDDCDDKNDKISPAATEICDGIDNQCDAKTDEGCDDDGDKYCDSKMTMTSTALCSKSSLPAVGQVKAGDDCDDTVLTTNPGAVETCDDVDNNCNSTTDDACDKDGDKYCDAAKTVLTPPGTPAGTLPKVCPNTAKAGLGDDCNDNDKNINPAAIEICDGIDNNCSTKTDEGCDDDADGFCDAAMTMTSAALCSKSTKPAAGQTKAGDDCNDANDKVFPGQIEACNDLDDNCSGKADEGCDDDADGYCDSTMVVVTPAGKPAGSSPTSCSSSKPGQGDDCNDTNPSIKPSAPEVCNDSDDNCSGKIDEGCDDDKDGYCDVTMTVVAPFGKPGVVPSICLLSKLGQGDDCNDGDKNVNPGAAETCATPNVDDNCNGQTDEDNALSCVTYYKDADQDGYGNNSPIVKACKCSPDLANKLTAIQAGDCNDANAAINPGVKEKCVTAGVDDNCNGVADEDNAADCTNYWLDADSDTYGIGAPKCMCSPDSKNFFTATQANDCDDTKKAVNPAAAEVCNGIDDNCDTKIDPENSGGCKVYYKDGDSDTYGDAATAGKCYCAADAVYKVLNNSDCNDAVATVNPAAAEICDAIDNNCDSKTDDGCDDDGDLYCDSTMNIGSTAKCTKSSLPAVGQTKPGDDCDDTKIAINPGAAEICDGADNNCKLGTDEGCDDDGDKYCDSIMTITSTATCNKSSLPAVGQSKLGDDCLDTDALVNPGAQEVCDAADNNCVGGIDELCDTDGDKYCNSAMTITSKATCNKSVLPAVGQTKSGDDCDDAQATVHPGASEICNNIDENCDSVKDEGCDDDGDLYCDSAMTIASTAKCSNSSLPVVGQTKPGDDCDDTKSAVHPNATEICDAIDNNCISGIDEQCDADGDKYCNSAMTIAATAQCNLSSLPVGNNTKAGDDCDDTKASVHPGGTEICNNVDENCDSVKDEGCDDDGDKYCDSGKTIASTATCNLSSLPVGNVTKAGDDCDDTKASVHPGATEVCNAIDENCVGGVDEGCDDDGDKYCDAGFTIASTATCNLSSLPIGNATKAGDDCDDNKASVHPGGTEICNNIDENCDATKDEGCDDDGDKYCDSGMTIASTATCNLSSLPVGNVTKAGDDCDDTKASIHPGATEVCNAIDENCVSGADEGCDDDGDKYCDASFTIASTATCNLSSLPNGNNTKLGDDCDDTKAVSHPGAKEICDGKDNDCNTLIDDALTPADSSCNLKGVCAAAAVCNGVAGWGSCTYVGLPNYATQESLCDTLDNNCDGLTDDVFTYNDSGVPKAIGATCTAGCGSGTVKCKVDKTAADCTCP